MPFKWRDNSIRIFSVLIAVLLWVFVTNEQNPVTNLTYNVPLTAEQPEGYVLNELPKTVSVRVKGTKTVIGTLQRDDFSARVNISGAVVGEQELPVQVSAPPGVEVLQVTPQVIRIQIDKIVTKNVPVVVTLKGDVADGQQAGEPVLKPPVVAVQGPGKVLDQINQVGITVNVAGAADTVEREVAVETGADGVTVSPGRVTVTVPVQELPSKSLPVRARITGEPAAGYVMGETSVQPSAVEVMASGQVLENLTVVSTMAVDITGASGDVERDVPLLLPDGVGKVRPGRVQVNVHIVPEEEVPEQQPGNGNDDTDTGETEPEPE